MWGKDLVAVERIGRQLEGSFLLSPFTLTLGLTAVIKAGTIWLNEVHQYSPHQVFAPHKQSGVGAENGIQGLLAYTNSQAMQAHLTEPDLP